MQFWGCCDVGFGRLHRVVLDCIGQQAYLGCRISQALLQGNMGCCGNLSYHILFNLDNMICSMSQIGSCGIFHAHYIKGQNIVTRSFERIQSRHSCRICNFVRMPICNNLNYLHHLELFGVIVKCQEANEINQV